MGLEDARRTPLRRLTPAQRRRLSIAREIVRAPEVFYIEEPLALSLIHIYHHEQKVQYDVDDARYDKEQQRRFAVAQALKDAGVGIVPQAADQPAQHLSLIHI